MHSPEPAEPSKLSRQQRGLDILQDVREKCRCTIALDVAKTADLYYEGRVEAQFHSEMSLCAMLV